MSLSDTRQPDVPEETKIPSSHRATEMNDMLVIYDEDSGSYVAGASVNPEEL